MVDENFETKLSFLIPFFDYFAISSRQDIIKTLLISFVFIYFVKTLFLSFLLYIRRKFTLFLEKEISHRLLKIYLKKKYEFHQKKNSSEFIRNILGEVSLFCNGLIFSLIEILIETLVLFSIVILLLIYDPFITIISMSTFSLFGLIFFLFTKKKLVRLGYERQNLDKNKIKFLREIFDNIKFFLISGKSKKYSNDFEKTLVGSAKLNLISDFIQQIPRLIFDFILILILILIVFSSLFFLNKDLLSIVTSLGIFAAATFRILPSINKILMRLQNIKLSKSAINLVYNEFQNSEYNINNNEITKKINFLKLAIENINFSYTNKKVFELASLNIEAGKSYGFVGPSGSGKSTLLDIIMGLQFPEKGKILINNEFTFKDINKSWQSIIGYVPQKVVLFDSTIKNNIAIGEENQEIDEEILNDSIKQAQLENFCKKLSNGINTNVGENAVNISGGQAQRIGIARALYLKPKILILDEITSSLDLEKESKIVSTLEELKKKITILIVSHRLSTLRFCDEIYEISKNKINKIKKN